jgi:inosine/xanthosine triphosphatase
VKKLVVASHNPVKLAAAEEGFRAMFPETACQVLAVDVDTGIAAQPRSDAETLHGAQLRARLAQQTAPQAELWFGIEGGVQDTPEGMLAFAWVVAISAAGSGQARSGAFCLPPAVTALVRQGMELGEADDIVFGRVNSKQENGAVGLLTGDVIDRRALYVPAVIMALIPHKNPALYEEIHA